MMDDLLAVFEKAQQEVVQLNDTPDVQTKLKLYALFKQATIGEVEGEKPSAVNFVAQAKFDAWSKLAGLSKADAIQQYIDLVAQLKARDTK